MRLVAVLCALLAVASPGAAEDSADTFASELHDFRVEVLSDALDSPWGIAFLPDGSMLVTEQDGRLRRFGDGRLSPPLDGVPEVATGGQRGLLDVETDPEFADNGQVWLTLTEPGGRGTGISVVRATLAGSALEGAEAIFRQDTDHASPFHFGSRIAFAPDGTLFFTIGDRWDPDSAQDPMDHSGSVLRIGRDGLVPPDNPFADGEGALPEIWSIGHRNVQGIALRPGTGQIWTAGHGPTGGDEINRPEAGRNYGWPVISYGLSLSGGKVGVGTHKEGMEQPVHHWDPAIAPSSLAFYDGDLFPDWKGDMFVSALRGRMIVRLELEGDRVVGEERLLEGAYGRIRRVRAGPDGALYAITDGGELLRISPSG